MSHMAKRRITEGPLFHWFGYYDKLQVDPSGRYALGMAVAFEGRSPRADDVIQLGMIDLNDDDCWIPLGETSAWCWQQGCMLQWLPGSDSEVIWNGREGDHYVSHIVDVFSGAHRTLQAPIYTLSPVGTWAVTPDYRRINDMRPGYGYAGPPDPYASEQAPEGSGIWRVNLRTGEQQLVVSLAEVAGLPYPHDDLTRYKHWFNHLLYSPDGTRFEFLHRWRVGHGFHTRMLTAAADGSDIRVVDDYGHTSHFIWRDPRHILAWAYHPSHGERFYLYEDGTRQVEVVGPAVMVANGHCTYLRGGDWVLNDTYPDAERLQRLYLYHLACGTRVPLADLYAAPEYTGEWRCDLHPRATPDGRRVIVDSTHEGLGRQMYLYDVGEITDRFQ